MVLGVSAVGISVEIVSLSSDYIGRGARTNPIEPTTTRDFVIGLLCASILPGVCEETLFRGAIQGTLGRLGPSKSVLITAILFALFHLDPWNFLSPLFFGLVVGIMTFRSGSAIPAMIAHASANATGYTIDYLFGNDARGWLIIAGLSASFVVVFAIYLEKTRHQAAPPDLLAQVPAALSRRALAVTAAGTVTFVGLAFFVFCTLLDAHYVSRDEEVLGLHTGDRVLLLKGPLAQIGLAEGDIVEIEPDGRSRLVKLERCGRNRVWLVGWPEETPLDRREITGRVVRVSTESK
jgi:membrane protease YdiL (CAAX protease family)